MTDVEFKAHLEAAEKMLKLTAAAVSGLREKMLRFKPSPEKWCILEILAHLADVELVFGYRYSRRRSRQSPTWIRTTGLANSAIWKRQHPR